MKLYVWHGVLQDYTCGVMFAFANSVSEARTLVRKGANPGDQLWVESQAKPNVYTKPAGFAVWGGG